MSAPPQAFEALMMAVIEGRASEAQQEQLSQCLRESPAHRTEYRKQMQIHALLVWQHGGASREVTASPSPASKSLRPLWGESILALAAALVLLMSFGVWFGLRSSQPMVALEVLSGDCVPSYVAGQRVLLRQLTLDSGTLRFRLDSGAVVEATGPVEVELFDAMRMRVVRGNVTTDVGEHAKGFVVETANARVVDLGTRFGVSVGGSGDTDVVVFQGEVEVYDPLKNGKEASKPASLIEGEAMQISASGVQKRMPCVFSKGNSGSWSKKPPVNALITNVHDNSEDERMRICYRVGVGAMTAGVSLRQANPLRWRPITGTQLPDWLEGADWVETGSSYEEQLFLDLQITLARPAALYVLQDTRQPLPRWLREQFTDTGTHLLLEWPSKRPEHEGPITQQFTVWRRDVLQPGTMTLGPQLEPGQTGNGRMYRIAAKALP